MLVGLPDRLEVGVEVVDEWLPCRDVYVSDGVLVDVVEPALRCVESGPVVVCVRIS